MDIVSVGVDDIQKKFNSFQEKSLYNPAHSAMVDQRSPIVIEDKTFKDFVKK